MIDTAKWEAEEHKEAYKRQAFISWNHSNLLSSMFGGKEVELPNFQEYLNGMGLGDQEQVNEEEITKEEALEKASNIMKMLN